MMDQEDQVWGGMEEESKERKDISLKNVVNI